MTPICYYNRTLNTLRCKTYGGAKNYVAREWQKLVRMQQADENGFCTCISCNKRFHYKKMQGGHYRSRRHTRTLLPICELSRLNCNAQCVYCNHALGGNLTDYRAGLIDRHGLELVEDLEMLANRQHVFSREELAQMCVDMRAQIREQEKRLKGT